MEKILGGRGKVVRIPGGYAKIWNPRGQRIDIVYMRGTIFFLENPIAIYLKQVANLKLKF